MFAKGEITNWTNCKWKKHDLINKNASQELWQVMMYVNVPDVERK